MIQYRSDQDWQQQQVGWRTGLRNVPDYRALENLGFQSSMAYLRSSGDNRVGDDRSRSRLWIGAGRRFDSRGQSHDDDDQNQVD